MTETEPYVPTDWEYLEDEEFQRRRWLERHPRLAPSLIVEGKFVHDESWVEAAATHVASEGWRTGKAAEATEIREILREQQEDDRSKQVIPERVGRARAYARAFEGGKNNDEMTSGGAPMEAYALHRPYTEEQLALQAAMEDLIKRRLSEKQRDAVLLADIAGMTEKQAAKMLGVPMGTVKTRRFHARRQLRIALAEEFGEPQGPIPPGGGTGGGGGDGQS